MKKIWFLLLSNIILHSLSFGQFASDYSYLISGTTNPVYVGNSLIRSYSNSDAVTLHIDATKLNVGQLNSMTYDPSATGIFNVGTVYDGTESVRFRTLNNTGYMSMVQNTAERFSLSFVQASIPQLYLHPYGNIGIGTVTPSAKLEITDGTNSFRFDPTSCMSTISGPAVTPSQMPSTHYTFNGDPDASLTFLNYAHDNIAVTFDAYHNGGGWVSSHSGSNFAIYKASDELVIGFNAGTAKGNAISSFHLTDGARFSNDGRLGIGGAAGSAKLYVNGNVGIGTNSPNINAKLDVNGNIYSNGKIAVGPVMDWTILDNNPDIKLAVNGTAIFTKARVKLYSAPWPDYVFSEKFKLPKLEEIEQYIQKNQHLPEVPTAAEVEKNGLDIGDNQALLLKKIEELTLFVIEQNKKVNELTKNVTKLTEENKAISTQLQNLEK